jgi:hypothetical protein
MYFIFYENINLTREIYTNILKEAMKRKPAGSLFIFIPFNLNLFYLCTNFMQEIKIVRV